MLLLPFLAIPIAIFIGKKRAERAGDIFGNKISEDKFTDITKTKYKDIFDDYLTSNKESHIKYEYTYDNQDNWIEFSSYENDKELFHTNRKIEYYSFWEFLKNYFE